MNTKKTLTTIAALSMAASALCGAEVEKEAAEAATDEHEPPWFEAGFDNDIFTAYAWRNSIVNDRVVWQPCVWADFTRVEPFYLGFSIWQNWDLTKRRAKEGMPRAMNETDYNVHLGATAWESEDEEWSVSLELGHEWYTYRPDSGWGEDYPASYEFYLKAEFNNPFVGVYGQYSQAYHPVKACHFEVGLTKEVTIGELMESENDILNRLSVGADWNVNFGSGKYLTAYLYGVGSGRYVYDEETEEEYFENDNLCNGIGGTTFRLNVGYEVCDCLTIGLVGAYTAVLNQDARDGLEAVGYGGSHKNLAWGGVQVKLSF